MPRKMKPQVEGVVDPKTFPYHRYISVQTFVALSQMVWWYKGGNIFDPPGVLPLCRSC